MNSPIHLTRVRTEIPHRPTQRRMIYIGVRDAWSCWRARLGECRRQGHQPWRYGSGLEMYCARCHQHVYWDND